MTRRLGEYECPNCRYSEPVVAPAPKEEKPSDYGGIKRARLILPPSLTGEAQPQAPTISTAATHGAETYIRGAVPPEGLHGYVEPEKLKRRPVNEALTAEKHVYFTVLTILLLGPALYYMFRVYMVPDAYLQIPKLLYLSGILLAALIPLAIAWLALYTALHFLKWAFIGLCTLFMVLVIIVLLIIAGRPAMWQTMAYTTGGLGPTLAIVGVLVVFAWTMWFISILYRDIRFLETST